MNKAKNNGLQEDCFDRKLKCDDCKNQCGSLIGLKKSLSITKDALRRLGKTGMGDVVGSQPICGEFLNG